MISAATGTFAPIDAFPSTDASHSPPNSYPYPTGHFAGFLLAEGIEVADASLDNGLLHIDLVRPPPEPNIRTVEIHTAGDHAVPVSRARKAKQGP